MLAPPCSPLTSGGGDSLHPATHLGAELLIPHVTVTAVPAAQKHTPHASNRHKHDAQAELPMLAGRIKLAVLAEWDELAGLAERVELAELTIKQQTPIKLVKR